MTDTAPRTAPDAVLGGPWDNTPAHDPRGPLHVLLPGAFAYRYADAEVDTSTFEARVGSCYTLAVVAVGNFVRRGWRDVTLVHGIIGPLGNPHAWVEFRVGGHRLVWDPTLDNVVRHDWYRDEWKARVWHRYTPRQAATHLLAENHHGPWGADDARYDARVKAMEEVKAGLRRPVT